MDNHQAKDHYQINKRLNYNLKECNRTPMHVYYNRILDVYLSFRSNDNLAIIDVENVASIVAGSLRLMYL